MRNAQTFKLMHNWQPANLSGAPIVCARCGLPQSRGNTWSRCSGIMGVLTNVQGTPFQARDEETKP